MKASPKLLSYLLVTSVALLNSGAVWSATQAGEHLAKSTANAVQKDAKQRSGKVKRAKQARGSAKKLRPPEAALPLVPAQAAAPVVINEPAVVVNPYQPGVAAVMIASVPNPYVPVPVEAAPPPLALTQSLSLASVASSVPPVAEATSAATPVVAPASVSPEEVVRASVARPAPEPVAVTPAAPASNPWTRLAEKPVPSATNPYLVNRVAYYQAPGMTAMANPTLDLGLALGGLRDFLPDLHLPSPDIDILPSITKVYPTGERPMYVLTFKCPTELVGLTPPPTKALRWLISSGMDVVNSTNLLSFSMQQVCQ